MRKIAQHTNSHRPRLCSEAVLVLLRMPGLGMLVQRRAVDGALEVLKADLTLDRLGSGIL